MHRDVDKILDEIIEKKRNSGYGIIWEELFRVDYKKAYEKAYEEAYEEYKEAYEEGAKQIREKVATGLSEEGWTIEKIALVLEEDVETVKKWLQQI